MTTHVVISLDERMKQGEDLHVDKTESERGEACLCLTAVSGF